MIIFWLLGEQQKALAIIPKPFLPVVINAEDRE
jgi:hypothetical protein